MSTQYQWFKSVIIVAVIVFLSAAPRAQAEILTWTGTSSADWFTGTNWTPNPATGVPLPADHLTLNLGNPVADFGTTVTTDGGGSITLNSLDFFSSAAFDNLVIGSAGTGTVNVGGTVDQGGADFSANTVSINNTGSRFDVLETFDFFVGNLTASNSGAFLVDLAVTDIPDPIVDTATFQSGASMTVSSGNVAMSSLTLQGVNTAYQGAGGSVETAALTLSDGASVDITGSHVLNVTGTTTIGAGANPVSITTETPNSYRTGALVLNGGQLNASNGLVLNKLSGFGGVNGPISGDNFADITATGSLALGNANSFLGFNYNGSLNAVANTVTLNAAGFANLGVLTTLSGGTIQAANGVALGVGDNISGSGQVNAKLAAASGSTIEATGSLALGDATKVDGFFSDGQLLTKAHTVTINDANMIVLGSLTRLGDSVSSGGLIAGTALTSDTAPHFLVEEGKNLVGRGNIAGNVKNNGAAIGDGTALAERLTFDAPWIVSGKGSFENTLVLGIFAPGESPAIVDGTDQAFGGTIEIELGGTTPGSGDDNHDQINDSATILLVNNPTLSILPWNNFIPTVGDEFEIITWQTALDGIFGDILVDQFFIGEGIDFDLVFTNTTNGPGNLTLRAITFIPEPGTATVVILMAMGLPMYRRAGSARRGPGITTGCWR